MYPATFFPVTVRWPGIIGSTRWSSIIPSVFIGDFRFSGNHFQATMGHQPELSAMFKITLFQIPGTGVRCGRLYYQV
jgi:hypothetical protein